MSKTSVIWLKIFGIFTMLMFSTLFSQTNTYYVDVNNLIASDSNIGSEDKPWKTIQKAASTLEAGDTVFIKAGSYNEHVHVHHSGTKNNYIVFAAYPGDELKVIITSNNISSNQFEIIGKSYIKVTGIRRELGKRGFRVEGPSKGIILDGNYTYGTTSSGISVWGVPWQSDPGNYDNIRNIIVTNNTVEKACDGGSNECITFANGVVNFQITNNTVKNGGDASNGGEGIDIKEGCSYGIIAYNHIHHLTRRGLYLDGGRYKKRKPIVEHIQIYNNIIHDQSHGGGLAIMTEGTGDVRYVKIYNNIIYNNESDGIMFYKHPYGVEDAVVHDITTVNNVCYNNGRNGILSNFWTSYNMIIRNNICYKNANKDLYLQSGSNISDHNLVGVDPNFIDDSNYNFHLQTGSPAIDSGSVFSSPIFDYDGMDRPFGEAVDIGAFEYGSTNPSPMKYYLKINNGSGEGLYDLFERVTVTASNAPEGKKFDSWSGDVDNLEDINSSTTYLIMPDSNITITAEYRVAMPKGNGAGSILREVWKNIRGTELIKLTSNANFPDNPTERYEDSLLEIPSDNGDNYGTRISGYLQPPLNGNYTFWIAARNEAELWLSSNEYSDSLKKIAFVSSVGTSPHNWDDSTQLHQKSEQIELIANNKYYIKILHKAGIGRDDNLSVAWLLENSGYEREIIEGEYLSPDLTVNVEKQNNKLPLTTELMANYPNPFNPETTIEYSVSKRDFISLDIYNILGQKITTLVNQEKDAGIYKVEWNAFAIPSGIYFSKFTVSGKTQTHKMILLK